jgi:23S rRNA pseudouridine1911/1915/1917 synthase
MSEKKEKQMKRHYRDPSENFAELDEDALFDHYTLTASPRQKPLRVDKFLANLLPFTTRSKIKNASRTGSITINDKEVKPSYKVRANDVVKLMLPFPPPPEIEPEDIPLDIRYEDEHLLIINKAPGMVCHPSLGHRSGTLIHALLWHFDHLPEPAQEQEFPRPGLIHRLDKDTSGILAIAKQEYAMAHVSKQFFDRTTDREYQAIVWGDLKEDQGTIVAHIARNPRDRKSYAAFPDGSAGKHAITHYEVLERFGVCTLVKCKLETGRTHQIRVHMKHIGHPLFSDKLYGGDRIRSGPPNKKYQQFMRNCFAVLPRQALHAKSLALTHPISGERMEFDSELPPDFWQMLEKLRIYANSKRLS